MKAFAGAHLLHASTCCQLEDCLDCFLVEVSAIASKAQCFALDLIPKGVKQRLHPAHPMLGVLIVSFCTTACRKPRAVKAAEGSPVGQVVVSHEDFGLLAETTGPCLLPLNRLRGYGLHLDTL